MSRRVVKSRRQLSLEGYDIKVKGDENESRKEYKRLEPHEEVQFNSVEMN